VASLPKLLLQCCQFAALPGAAQDAIVADATTPSFSLVGRTGLVIYYTVMSQLIFFVLLKDLSKFKAMNEIYEIELKLPQALFNKRFGNSGAEGIAMSILLSIWL
jgi:hypothetical protein